MHFTIMVYLIVLFALLVRLIGLSQSFWLDEAAQGMISRQNLLDVNWAADFQPPGYYIITWLWQKIGVYSEWFLRLPSVFFGIATIYVLFSFINETSELAKGEHKNRRFPLTASIAGILLATSPYHIYFSQEYRMYAAATFLITISWYFLWKNDMRKYSFSVFLSVFTHYFAFFSIFSQLCYVFIAKRDKFKQFLRFMGLGLFPFVFWLKSFIEQIRTAGMLLNVWPGWADVAGTSFLKFPFLVLAKFTVGHISPEPKWVYGIAVAVAGVIFTYILISLSRIRNSIKTLFLFWFFLPLLLVWFSSIWITGNSPHRLLFVLPALYVIIGMGLGPSANLGEKLTGRTVRNESQGSAPSRWGAHDKVKLILFVMLLSSNIYFSSQYLLNESHHREDWRSAVSYSDNKIEQGGVVLTEYVGPWAPMMWYSKSPNHYMGASNEMKVSQESVQAQYDFLPTTHNIILYSYLYEITDPARLVEKYLASQGFDVVEERDFRGVGIVKVLQK